jgi:hypothetical protein
MEVLHMEMVSHTGRKRGLLALALAACAALVFTFALAPRAFAFYNVQYTQPCSNCHSTAGPAPVVTLVSNNETTATYSVAGNGQEWAVFNGSTRVAGSTYSDGNTFSVADGVTYTVYDVIDASTAGHTTVTPSGGSVATTFTITPSAGANGSISPSTVQTVASGANATFTITPNSGYHVATLLVNGTAVTAATSYTFTNVTSNQTIAATFAADTTATQYTLTPSVNGGHGSIAPSSVLTVAANSTYTFRIQPDVGYHIATVLVDSVPATATLAGTYTFTNVTANHTIVVTFAAGALPGSYAIMPTAGAHGTVGPVASAFVYGPIITVQPNTSYTLRVTPDVGYHVASVLVDDATATLTSGGLYTFTNITASHTFAVTFAPNAATSLSLKTSSTSLTHGKSVTLSAVLKGGVSAGTKVTFQVKAPGKSTYTTISTVGVSTAGAASKKYKLSKKGTYYFRVVFSGSTSFAPSTSSSIKVKSK